MIVKSVYPLKSFTSLKEAQAHVKKLSGKRDPASMEIHWNKKAKSKAPLGGPSTVGLSQFSVPAPDQKDDVDDSLQWVVVVVGEDMIPGGSTCAECEQTHFSDDYLCPGCRAEM